MKGTVVLAIVSFLGCLLLVKDAEAVSTNRRKRDQMYLTTPDTTTEAPSTTISISPQTSVSVHHTVVRNKPAHAYPFNEPTLESDGTEDTSYYYTYEDISEEPSKQITSTASTPTSSLTTPKTARSFWNSQKALLDARRKESAQKFIPTYNKPAPPSKESKPAIEFKTREKPKFGLNKNRISLTTTKQPEVTTTVPVEAITTNKVVKSDFKLNLPIQNLAEKDLLKALKESNILPNQIIGRVGEIATPTNQATQSQSTSKAQSTNINRFGSSRLSKQETSSRNVQYVDQPLQQQNAQNQQSLLSSALLNNDNNNAPPFLLNLNQQQSASPNNNQQTLASIQSLIQAIKRNQENANVNLPARNAFITASAPIGSGRVGDFNLQSTGASGSGLLQRLGALGLGSDGDSDLLNTVARDGGGGKGISLNLGPVPDPITLLLKLLQLLPKPLLDLNGRIFFGIELGKNAALVGPGGAKSYQG